MYCDPKKWLRRHRFKCANTFAPFFSRECRVGFLEGRRAQTLARLPAFWLGELNLLSFQKALCVRAAIASAGSPTSDSKLSQRQSVLESVSYGDVIFEWKGVVMTGEDNGEKAVTQSRSLVDSHAGIAGSPRENQTRPAGSSVRDGDVTTLTNPSVAALEQWLCLLLGASCMVCGVWGICMKYSQGLSSRYVQWLGPAYGPALRLTALACFGFGAVLVRLGLTRPGRSSDSDTPKV
jgi:hypothetical protein